MCVVLVSVPLMMACGVQRHSAQGVEPRRVGVSQPVAVSVDGYALPGAEPVASVVPEIRFQDVEHQYVRVSSVRQELPVDGLKIRLDGLAGEFTYPVQGALISDYGLRGGRRHTGIDIRAAHGDTIRAALPGVVRMSKLYSSYGNIVVIRHYNGLETVYSHNTRNLVSPNDVVVSGQPIALAGRTGRATTDHLHFEVRASGEPIDPKLLVDPASRSLRNGWLFINDRNGHITAATSAAELQNLMASAEETMALDTAARDKAISQSQTPPTPDPIYYTIKYGDILGRIAQKYNTTVSQICTLNNLKSPDKIREGQRLRIQ
jgi:murein DD-endopeptidase MepM/ murein hydrolase activator NlpD